MIEALFREDCNSTWDEEIVAAMYLLGANANSMALSEEQRRSVATVGRLLRELPLDSARELALEMVLQGAARGGGQ